VNWLHPTEVPVAVASGSLIGRAERELVELDIETNLDSFSDLVVERRTASPEEQRRWREAGMRGVAQGKEGLCARLVDNEPAGWPRTYTLMLAASPADVVLDRIELTLPQPVQLQLSALPNPFNPRVELRYALPEPGMVRMDVYNARGVLVRNLFRGRSPSGKGLVIWHGDDAGGRPVASGVYHVRLGSDRQEIRKSITLVR
jgi:hypothetical protein